MKLYHYTLGIKLEGIMGTGVIRTSPLKPKWPEKPIAWLSSNETFEPSAIKIGMNALGQSKMMSLEQMESVGQGLYRFVFDSEQAPVEFLSWTMLRPRSKAKPKMIKRLLDRAKSANANPDEWYGSFDEIPVAGARLEVATFGDGGQLMWKEAKMPKHIDTTGIIQLTVDESKQIGLGVKCTDETWAEMR